MAMPPRLHDTSAYVSTVLWSGPRSHRGSLGVTLSPSKSWKVRARHAPVLSSTSAGSRSALRRPGDFIVQSGDPTREPRPGLEATRRRRAGPGQPAESAVHAAGSHVSGPTMSPPGEGSNYSSPPPPFASAFMRVLHGTKVEPGYSLKVRWVHREDRQVVCYGGCGDHGVESARLHFATSPS